MSEPVVYEEPAVETRISPFVSMSARELMGTILCGMAVGVVVATVYFLLNRYVFGVVLCRAQSPSNCSQAPFYSLVAAMVIGMIGGVANLVRMRVYRPLLVGLAAVVALWGGRAVVANATWYWAVLAVAVLFGLTYGLFGWIARIRNFLSAFVVTLIIVVLVRWMLVA